MINEKHDSYEDMKARQKWCLIAMGLLSAIDEGDEHEEIKTDLCEKKTQVHFVLEKTKQALEDWYNDEVEELRFPSLWDTIGLDDSWAYNEVNEDIFANVDIEDLPVWIDALEYVIDFLFTNERKIEWEAWDRGRLYA